MNINERITQVHKNAPRISFTDEDKFVLMSDIHRNDGSTSDAFLPNLNIMMSALRHYYEDGFTYVELGDGDELWMNKTMDEIKVSARPMFHLLKRFDAGGRLYMLYGNHDMKKKERKWAHQNLAAFHEEHGRRASELLPGVQITEGLVLHQEKTGRDILLIHGHQADFLNYDLWKVAKFLVRYFWRPLSLLGIKDPTSASNSGKKKGKIAELFSEWAQKEGHIVIAGHTHQAVYPEPGEPAYFNDGCCVHPRHITAIEIVKGNITLVKWLVRTRKNDTLYVTKEILSGPTPLEAF